MHRTTSSVIAFAATIAGAVQAAALICAQGPVDDLASAVDALASASTWRALAGPARFPGGARVAQPDPQHGWAVGSRVAADGPPRAAP